MPRAIRTLWGSALVVLAAGAFAAQASAHGGDPDYRSQVNQIVPGTPGISAEILDYDADLQLTNHSNQEVTIFGYQGEPYLRFEPDGTVEINTTSPAYYLNEDRYADVQVPDSAQPGAAPQWKTIDKSGSYIWHDHRSHYMAQGTLPPQVKDKSKKTKVFDYKIPIQVGRQKGDIDGTLFWVGHDSSFPIAPFLGLGAVVLILGGVVLARRRRSGEPKEAW